MRRRYPVVCLRLLLFILPPASCMLSTALQPVFADVSEEELRRERIETIEQLKRTEEVFGTVSRLGAGMLDKYGWFMDYGGVVSLTYTGGSNNDRSEGHDPGSLDSIDHTYDYELNVFGSLTGRARMNKFYVRLKTKYTERKKSGTATTVRGSDYAQANFDLAYFEKKMPTRNFQHTWTVGRQFISVGRGIAFGQVADGLNVSIKSAKGRVESHRIFAARQLHRDDNSDIYNASTVSSAGHTDRQFYGVEVKFRLAPKHKLTFYYVINDDKNTETHPIAGRHQYDSKFLGYGLNGSLPWIPTLTYFGEYISLGGKNFGRAATNASTQRDIVKAFAFDIGLKYNFVGNKYDPSLHLRYSASSGDPDRVVSAVGSSMSAGNLTGTTDHAFQPFGGVSLGYALAPGFSNIRALQIGGDLNPWKGTRLFNRATVAAAYYVYWKDISSGPTSDPLGAAAAPRDDLGSEWNLSMNWKILSDFRSELRMGLFRPGEVYGSTRSNEKYIRYKFRVDL